MGTIAWDQTLLSLALAAVAAWVAYRGAARVLRRQEQLRELRARRDALDQVLRAVDGPVAEYLGSGEEYPQREMVELERHALQAQIYYLRDRDMQAALRDICYPERHGPAIAAIRRAVELLDRDIAAVGRGG